jgi:hypothetical protein
MTATLETLELTPQELDSCKQAVRKMAYKLWLDAGRPECGQVDFWLAAERDWIESNYVPHRTFDGLRPQADAKPADLPAKATAPAKSRAHKRPRAKAR